MPARDTKTNKPTYTFRCEYKIAEVIYFSEIDELYFPTEEEKAIARAKQTIEDDRIEELNEEIRQLPPIVFDIKVRQNCEISFQIYKTLKALSVSYPPAVQVNMQDWTIYYMEISYLLEDNEGLPTPRLFDFNNQLADGRGKYRIIDYEYISGRKFFSCAR